MTFWPLTSLLEERTLPRKPSAVFGCQRVTLWDQAFTSFSQPHYSPERVAVDMIYLLSDLKDGGQVATSGPGLRGY